MKTWLIIGSSGLLGNHLSSFLVERGYNVIGTYLNHQVSGEKIRSICLDVTDLDKLEIVCAKYDFDVICNTAAITNVDSCEHSPEEAKRLHAEVSGALAAIALEKKSKYIYISTDHLWKGDSPLVVETQQPEPLNVYAKTKWEGELQALKNNPDSLIIRTNFFGGGESWHKSFSDWTIEAAKSGKVVYGFADVFFTPIGVKKLCALIEELTLKEASGIYNVAGSERVSKYDFMIRLTERLGLDNSNIVEGSMAQSTLKVPRPYDMSLDMKKTEKLLGRKMPDLNESFDDLLAGL